jgi:hypothetical protein
MVGSFLVKSPTVNEAFNVGAGKLTHKKRIELWDKKDSLIGKYLIVKHEFLTTANNIPLCAVAVEVEGI